MPENMLRPTNLVNQHKKMAESFLKSMIAQKAAPRNFSGIMCPRFGGFVMVWQFDKSKLVGAAIINVNNIDNFADKMRASKSSIDWFNLMKENDEPRTSEPS